MSRADDVDNIAFELARASFVSEGPLQVRAREVADRLAAERGADICELLDAGEAFWRDTKPARGAAADAIRRAADYARCVGNDDLASDILKLLFEE